MGTREATREFPICGCLSKTSFAIATRIHWHVRHGESVLPRTDPCASRTFRCQSFDDEGTASLEAVAIKVKVSTAKQTQCALEADTFRKIPTSTAQPTYVTEPTPSNSLLDTLHRG